MSGSDDWDDPALGRSMPTAAEPSFWSSVRWRWRFGLVLSLLAGVGVCAISTDSYAWRDAVRIGAVTLGAVGVVWFGCRILWAWLEWPSDSPVVRTLKATCRLLFFDTEAERRAAGTIGDAKASHEGPVSDPDDEAE